MTKQRTLTQNKAMWKMFEQLSQMLNEAGLDVRKTLKPEIDILWTKEMINQYMWKPLLKVMFNKTSTTQMTTTEINKVFEVISRHIATKHGLTIEFPSIESMSFTKLVKGEV